MASGGARAVAILAAVTLAGVGACTEISTSATVPVAIAFDSLPWPAVVAGDTLRDSLGNAVQLKAVAFNGKGDTIAGNPILFISPDTKLVVIDSDGYLVAKADSFGIARVIADAGGLQSLPLSINVVPKPVRMSAPDSLATTYYAADIPQRADSNTTVGVIAQVLSDSLNADSVVTGWIVRYALVYHGDTLAPSDTSIAFLINDAARRSTFDTTDASGNASRRVRFHPAAFTAVRDSLTVVVRASYRGADLAGSPKDVLVRFAPDTAAPPPTPARVRP